MDTTITLGGRERTLRYDLRARVFIEKRTGKAVLAAAGSGLLEEQAVVILAGLGESLSTMRELEIAERLDRVLGWLDDLREEGRDVRDVLDTVVAAVGASGICGFRFELRDGRVVDLSALGKGDAGPGTVPAAS